MLTIEIETWAGYEMYHQKLLMMKDVILNVGYEMCTSNKCAGSYNVLINGDLNYKKILVTKKKGIVVDFVLVNTELQLILEIVYIHWTTIPAGLSDIILGITSFGYHIRSVHDG